MRYFQLYESVRLDEISIIPDKVTLRKILRGAVPQNLKLYGKYRDVSVYCDSDLKQDGSLILKKDGRVIGAATLQSGMIGYDDAGYYMEEIALDDEFRFEGYGYDLYKFLMSKGMTILAGRTQTANARKLWTKLMSDPGVTVKCYVVDEDDNVEYFDPKEVPVWNDPEFQLCATSKEMNESVMIDEISANNWWNMSDADMDTNLNVIKMNSLEFFDDINATYSVYSKVNKEFNDRLKKYKLYIYDKNAQRLIGYAQVLSDRQRSTWRMTVHEIALRPSYRGKNIAYDFYLMLMIAGYTVVSDGQQTKGGASIWKRLMNDPRIKVTAYDDVNRREVDPADAWNHENPHAQLKAEMVSENRLMETRYAEPIGDDDVKHGINYVVRYPMKIFGVTKDNVIVSRGFNGSELVFLFSKGREAAGYANGHILKITIDDKKYEVLTITDIGLYEKFTKQGIGFEFYNMLMENGYALMNDETQTIFGEKLWKKLMRQNGVGVTTVKRGDSKKKNDYEHVDMVADDPWTMKNVRIIIQAGNQEITEGTPRVAAIQLQPKGLSRCTTVSCNAIFAHFKAKLITSNTEVPQTAKDCFERIQQRGLKILPDVMSPQKKIPLNIFANTHRNGVWLVGTKGHSMCLIDGELFDAENKGLDSRPVLIAAQVKR